ncbi:hypothetical protein GCM10009662_73410 [Catellatospora coxensis]|uniref:hypothetical protein n=1 Tax=Catellatospora coxensis TaxID=310354 RepID=UPI0031DF7534
MGWKYHSPPGWPTPPEDWTPPEGWRPDPAWPPAPEGWQFWVGDGADDDTLLFELPDDEPFTSLDELIGDPAPADGQPVAGVPLADPVPVWSVPDEVAAPAATDLEPSVQPEPALVAAMEATEPAADAAQPTAGEEPEPVPIAQPVVAAEPVPAAQPVVAAEPVLAAQTAMAMDAAAQAAWSDERPQPVWPVDPALSALSAEPGWIPEPAPASEPDIVPAEPELVVVAAVAGPEPFDPADTPGFEPIVPVTGPVAPVYGLAAAAPLTSGIAWPSPVDPSPEPAPDAPVATGPAMDVPVAGVPAVAVPAMAFAAELPDAVAGVAPPPDAAHVPAHAATHVPAHAAPARRKPWWVWGLAGAAGLLLCTVVGVGGFVATRIGGTSGAVADPSATEVGEQPDAEATRQAQGRPIPTPSRQAAEALPQDQIFEGVGPRVVPVELGSTFHTVALTYTGTGPFVVRTVKADGQEIQTLVSAAESYEGVRPLDLGEMRPDAVSIQAEGGWRMVVRPLASAQTFSGNASGVGADVLLIPRTAAESVKVAFDHRGTGKFTVQAIGSDSATLINQEGDFTGEAMLPRGTVVVVIDTNGVWTFSRE